jgi:hypothetical protein
MKGLPASGSSQRVARDLLIDRRVRAQARHRRLLGLGLTAVVALSTAVADAVSVSWRRSLLLAGDSSPRAIAYDARGGRLAVGDASGVYLGDPGGALERVIRRAEVRDLAFLADGSLLVATADGLFALDRDGRLEDRSPRAGGASRSIHRIARTEELVAIATAGGAYLSSDAAAWVRIRGALPSGSVESVALHPRTGEATLWLVARAEVWRAVVHSGFDTRPGASPLAIGAITRQAVFEGSLRGAVDIGPEIPGTDVAVVLRDAIAVRDAADQTFRILRPVLPAGAQLVRLATAEGRFWLMTDRGLLEAERLEGPWQRARPPAGRAAAMALVRAGVVLYVATATGLLEGRSSAPIERPAGAESAPLRPDEPDIESVHRVALAYLDLGPERMRELRKGVDRRGLFPIATLRFAHDWRRSRNRDYDEAFLSGEMRRLYDWDRERDRDYEVSIALTWDLGDTQFHPEALDVSREGREVLELRDDVLDEITQLYFERRRVLMDLALLGPDADSEAFELRRRADELAAGIDAWTGGWFGRHAPSLLADARTANQHPAD